MRHLILLTAALFLSCATVSAQENDRNIAVKLTQPHKPEVRVMTEGERTALLRRTTSFDLSADPNQIVCRTERLGVGSRLSTRRCKTTAEIREEKERNRMLNGSIWEAEKRKYAMRNRNAGRTRTVIRTKK